MFEDTYVKQLTYKCLFLLLIIMTELFKCFSRDKESVELHKVLDLNSGNNFNEKIHYSYLFMFICSISFLKNFSSSSGLP